MTTRILITAPHVAADKIVEVLKRDGRARTETQLGVLVQGSAPIDTSIWDAMQLVIREIDAPAPDDAAA